MSGLDYTKKLSPESNRIHKRNVKRQLYIFAIVVLVYVGIYIYAINKPIYNLTDTRASIILAIVSFWLVSDILYTILNRGTYWQLRSRDIAKASDKNKKELTSTKGVWHGN